MRSARLTPCVAFIAVAFCATIGVARSEPVDAHPERVLPAWVEVQEGAWRVPPELVREMAQRLQEGPTHADLRHMVSLYGTSVHMEDYTVQYRRELIDGARLVRLEGNCHGHYKSGKELSSRFFVVMDGGPCMFDAAYSPSDQRFTAFALHSR